MKHFLPEVIASFEIDGDSRVWEMLEVDGKNLLGDVIVVQLVVAQGHVDVQGQVLTVVQQYPLVNVNSLLP